MCVLSGLLGVPVVQNPRAAGHDSGPKQLARAVQLRLERLRRLRVLLQCKQALLQNLTTHELPTTQ